MFNPKIIAIKVIKSMLHLVLIAILVLLTFVLVNQSIILPLDSKILMINDVDEYPIGGIQGENPVTQTFLARQSISKIGVKMATYGRVNQGEVYFRLYDPKTMEIFHEEAIAAATVADNAFHVFTLAMPLPAQSRAYAFEISGITPVQGQSIGLWSTRENSYQGGQLYYGEYETEGDLSFYLIGTESIHITSKILISTGLALLLFGIIFSIILIQSKKGRSNQHV